MPRATVPANMNKSAQANANPVLSLGNTGLLRNELIIGAGITLLGGVIGFTYGVRTSGKQGRTGIGAVGKTFGNAFTGALIGLILAILAVLAYRIYFHAKAVAATNARATASA